MNIAHIETNSFIYGPGCRFVIWVQGCSIHCKGCWNKEMWSFDVKSDVNSDQLISQIMNEADVIEGVTILGGEPFDQYSELLPLVKLISEAGLSVVLYSGYSRSEILNSDKDAVFAFTDILITDRYNDKLNSTERGLVGSSNQEIYFLSNKYSATDLSNQNEVEVTIDIYGGVNIYGYPEENL